MAVAVAYDRLMAEEFIHADVFGSGPRAVFVHGSFGWGLDTFPEQRALADAYEVVLVDRRGFGASPLVEDPGWHHDSDDVLDWIGGGAHLVGQSYGGVVCLLAAAARPECVRSLTVIEPVAASVARGGPAVDAFATAMTSCADAAAGMTAAEFFVAWQFALGRSGPFDTDGLGLDDWRAVEATRRERPAVDAPIDVGALATATFPKMIVKGAWPASHGPDLLRDATAAICAALRTAIGRTARRVRPLRAQPTARGARAVQRRAAGSLGTVRYPSVTPAVRS
jgi:pimeloyl-ACP methyl ester carboxylesterase